MVIQQHLSLRTLFATLRKVESENFWVDTFRDQSHGEVLEVLIPNRMELPEMVVDEESLERISSPFAEGFIDQYTHFYWSAFHIQPSNDMVWFYKP